MNPHNLALWVNAQTLDRQGKGPEAVEAYQRFLEREPQHAPAWTDLAGQLLVLNRLEEAREACRQALELAPNELGPRVNLGCILIQEGQPSAAIPVFQEVLAQDRFQMSARLALIGCLIRQGRLAEAEAETDLALRQEPWSLPAHQHKGAILYSLARWKDLEAEIQRFRGMDATSAYGEFEQGFVDLLFGRWEEGWTKHEARWQVPGLVKPKRDGLPPRWDGSPFPGQRLLLFHEQGLGDTLMLLRYLPQVKTLGGEVILEVQPELEALARTCAGTDAVVTTGASHTGIDLCFPLMSLPWLFRSHPHDLPCEIPYLDVPPAVPSQVALQKFISLAASHGLTRIGLVWAGNSAHIRDWERSIPANRLAPLGSLPGIAWFGFQLGTQSIPSLPNFISLAPFLRDFSDTAYALSGMDLLISVDTSVAHLAGALGIPTFLLITHAPDWRWLLDREDSPWYPSLRLYRQPRPGDWDATIQALVRDLSTLSEA